MSVLSFQAILVSLVSIHSNHRYEAKRQKPKTTLETSGEDVKTTLETSGEDVETTPETSGEDVQTTLETSGEDHIMSVFVQVQIYLFSFGGVFYCFKFVDIFVVKPLRTTCFPLVSSVIYIFSTRFECDLHLLHSFRV